jgi:hypothetical protein
MLTRLGKRLVFRHPGPRDREPTVSAERRQERSASSGKFSMRQIEEPFTICWRNRQQNCMRLPNCCDRVRVEAGPIQ